MIRKPQSRTYKKFLEEMRGSNETKFIELVDRYAKEYTEYLTGMYDGDVYEDQYEDIERTILFTDSPIERLFYVAMKNVLFTRGYVEGNAFQLLPQYKVETKAGKTYHVDFSLLYADFDKEKFYSLFIELNGHDYHSNKQQLTRDKKRERELDDHCDRIITFTGTEIYEDVEECADEAISIMLKIVKEKR